MIGTPDDDVILREGLLHRITPIRYFDHSTYCSVQQAGGWE